MTTRTAAVEREYNIIVRFVFVRIPYSTCTVLVFDVFPRRYKNKHKKTEQKS